MLIVTWGSRAVQNVFLQIAYRGISEIREDLVARIFLPLIIIMNVPGCLNVRILAALVEINACRAVSVKLSLHEKTVLACGISCIRRSVQAARFPEVLAVVNRGLNVVIARISDQQRLSHIDVITVVIRDIFERISVGKHNSDAVAVLKSQSVEIIDPDLNINSSEFRFMLNSVSFNLGAAFRFGLLLPAGRKAKHKTHDQRSEPCCSQPLERSLHIRHPFFLLSLVRGFPNRRISFHQRMIFIKRSAVSGCLLLNKLLFLFCHIHSQTV